LLERHGTRAVFIGRCCRWRTRSSRCPSERDTPPLPRFIADSHRARDLGRRVRVCGICAPNAQARL